MKPEAQTDPHHWAATLAGHGLIGIVLTNELLPHLPLWAAVSAVWVLYLIFWEVVVQRLGAGLLDALVDAAATAGGVVYAAAVYIDNPVSKYAAIAFFAFALAGGIWKRR